MLKGTYMKSKTATVFASLATALSLWSLPGFAEGDYSLSFSRTQGQTDRLRMAVVGSGICDDSVKGKPNAFALYIHDLTTGRKTPYTSASGNTSWKINCKFNQEISHELLKPNTVVEVIVIDQSQGELERSFLQIPCYDASVITGAQSIPLSRNVSLQEIQRTGVVRCAGGMHEKVTGEVTTETQVVIHPDAAPSQQPRLQPQQEQQRPVNHCRLHLESERIDSDRRALYIRGGCDFVGNYNLSVRTSDGVESNAIASNCQRSQYISSIDHQELCGLVLDANASTEVTASLSDSVQVLARDTKVYRKDPTFTQLPDVRFHNQDTNQLTKEEKSLGRGYYWSAELVARFNDADLDPLSGETFEVELILQTPDGRQQVIDSRLASFENDLARFTVSHEYVTPMLFGENTHYGPLEMGKNILFLRAHDAYKGNGYSESSKIVLEVKE